METWSFTGRRWQQGEQEGATLRWFRFEAPPPEEFQSFAAGLGVHPLAIEDCLTTVLQAPKIDDFEDHMFIVLHAVTAEAHVLRTAELDVFVGRDYLVTYSDEPLPEVQQLCDVMTRGVALRPGIDGLFYELADRVVDGLLPEIHDLGDRLGEIEDRVLAGERVKPEETRRIAGLRAEAGRVRRLLTPQLHLMQRLGRGEFALISEEHRVYFRDIYDHMVRADLALEEVREDAEAVLSSYLAAVNNQMSEVMKVLSVVAALALPATVISGIFGTNFDNVPGLHSNWGFAGMMFAMVALVGGMGLYFKRKGWW